MAKKNVARTASFIAVFTLLSKILGLVREAMLAAVYGASWELDVFKGALTITMISMTILGGALNTSLVPVFTEIEKLHGQRRKKEFFNKLYSGVFFLTVGIMILLIVAALPLAKIVLIRFTGDQLELAAKLVRISAPMVLFMGMTYVFQGYLHSENVFGPGALMGIPFNLVYFIYLGFFGKTYGMNGLMITSVLAAVMQALIQVPAVVHRKNSLRLTIPRNEPYLRKTLNMVIPIAIGTSVSQIDVIVDKALASGLQEGSLTVLDFAAKLNEGIVAVFIAALVTVLFPLLSRAFQDRNKGAVVDILDRGISLIFLITIPATLGIIALSYPLVEIVFERGNFHAQATAMTQSALIFYCIGMTGVGVRMFLSKVFYSLQKTTIPMYNGILAVAVNIVLNLILVRFMAHAGLALATGLSVNLASIILYKAIKIRFPEMNSKKHLIDFLKIGLSSLVMATVVHFTYGALRMRLPVGNRMTLLATVICTILGVLIYALAVLVLRVDEVHMLRDRMRRKIRS